MSSPDDSLARNKATILETGTHGRVVVLTATSKVMDEIEEQPRDRLTRIMQLWCIGKPLTEKMFNGNEGRSKGRKRLLMAFKAWKVRLYGCVGTLGGIKTFVIVSVDPAKKQEKADKNALKNAKIRIDDIDWD